METAMAMAADDAGAGRAEALAESLLAHSGAAYRVALLTLKSSEAAEDAVQQAYLEALRRIRAGFVPDDSLSWFLGVVANAARKQRRAEAGLKRREETAMRQPRDVHAPPDAELSAELARSLSELDDDHRLPVALCCQEGLTQRQAAAVLSLPDTTLRRRLDEGLDLLRARLTRAGYAAAPATVVGALGALPQLGAPAGLVVKIQALAAGAKISIVASGSAAATAAKGGLTMKIVAGVVLAGALAGVGVAVFPGKPGVLPIDKLRAPSAAEGPAEGTAPPAAAAEQKGEPVYDCAQLLRVGFMHGHSAFNWTGPAKSSRVDRFCALAADNDGNVYGAVMGMVGRGGHEGRLTHECAIMKWDPKTDMLTRLAGGARGAARDGPGEMAQFNYSWYIGGGGMAIDRKRGYLYISDNVNGKARRISIKDGSVTTLAPEIGKVTSVTADQDGVVYIHANYGTGLHRLTPEGKPGAETYKVERVGEKGGGGFLVADAKRGKVYVAGRGDDIGTVQVWDLKAFKGHPVKPVPIATPSGANAGNMTQQCGKSDGPLEGARFYCPNGLFGSPSGKYLYLGGGDQMTYRRIDVDARRISSFHLLPDGRYTWKEHKEKGEKDIYPQNGMCWPQCFTETDDGALYTGATSPGIMRHKIVGRQ